MPISFVTEHIETLHEINIEARADAKKVGIEMFRMMPAVGDSPIFIDGAEGSGFAGGWGENRGRRCRDWVAGKNDGLASRFRLRSLRMCNNDSVDFNSLRMSSYKNPGHC